MVTPIVEASSQAELNEVSACCVQEDSGPPQLMETTLGWSLVSCTAVVSASRKPWSEFGVQYIAIRAEGATAPETSISSSTSPSAPLGSPVGEFVAPSTETAVTVGVLIPRFLK